LFILQAGYTPLHTACHFGQLNMIRFLLEHGASVASVTKVRYVSLVFLLKSFDDAYENYYFKPVHYSDVAKISLRMLFCFDALNPDVGSCVILNLRFCCEHRVA
jgi:hypothetical protein